MPETREQQAWQLFNAGRLDESRAVTGELLRMDPANARLLQLDGMICARQQRYAEAEARLKAALEIERSYQGLLLLGQLYLVAGKTASAEACLLEASELQPESPEPRLTLGNLYAHLGKHEQAIESYRWLVENAHADAGVWGNMAISLEMLRSNGEARQAATEALQLDADNPSANLVLARLDRRDDRTRDSVARLQVAIANNQHPIHRANLLSELGHALDRMGDFDAAFDAFRRANADLQAVAASAPFDKDLYRRRIAHFRDAGTLPAGAGESDETGRQLIFFVGFPRSGTTLLEQILQTRPGVVTTQEEPLITDLIAQLTGGERRLDAYPAILAGLSASAIDGLRQLYMENLQRVTRSSGAGLTYIDKLPLNIIEAGFIHMLFPAARFIVALRDPRDVCLSCFMQSFKLNPATLHFLDLEDTARFYAAVLELWGHYKSILGGLRYHEYRYEDLVVNFDATSKQILEFVGVEWDLAVRSFHEQAGAKMVRTPSFIDVSTPLYTRAVGRWKNYGAQVAAIQDILAPYVAAFGYSAWNQAHSSPQPQPRP
ncbi:MAG: sulfotransferase [Pseudomonadota bacterium]